MIYAGGLSLFLKCHDKTKKELHWKVKVLSLQGPVQRTRVEGIYGFYISNSRNYGLGYTSSLGT